MSEQEKHHQLPYQSLDQSNIVHHKALDVLGVSLHALSSAVRLQTIDQQRLQMLLDISIREDMDIEQAVRAILLNNIMKTEQ